MNIKEKDYYGHPWQGGGAFRMRFAEGKAGGTKAVLADNGCGLSCIILEDRCLDIYSIKVNGMNTAYLSKCGPVNPQYYNSTEWEWLRSFGAGFLTTCGLTQAGEPCRYNNAEWGLHGPISNTPAENVTVNVDTDKIVIQGQARQYKFQTENMLLERRITIDKHDNQIELSDTISNEGWNIQPFMILYHFNFGYPLLNKNSMLLLPPAEIEGWDEYSNTTIPDYLTIQDPDAEYREQTYIHKLKGKSGQTGFAIADDRDHPKLAVACSYNCEHLPFITQWKHFKPSEYVMAIEPCNNHVKGAQWEKENGTLCTLAPGEKRTTHFKFSFLTGSIDMQKLSSILPE